MASSAMTIKTTIINITETAVERKQSRNNMRLFHYFHCLVHWEFIHQRLEFIREKMENLKTCVLAWTIAWSKPLFLTFFLGCFFFLFLESYFFLVEGLSSFFSWSKAFFQFLKSLLNKFPPQIRIMEHSGLGRLIRQSSIIKN